jgi:branched-chain amino acid transport system substrate-binding protein
VKTQVLKVHQNYFHLKRGEGMKKQIVVTMVVFIWIMAISFGAAYGAEKVFKIGLMGPMSGAGAAWGISMQRGVSMAIEDINKAGGLKVGNDVYRMEFVAGDTKYTGSVAVSESARLVFEQGIKHVIGPIGSSPTIAISPSLNENKILLFHNSFTPAALGPQFPYNFRALCSTTHEFAPILWRYVKEKYGVKTMVAVGQNDATGKADIDDDIQACKELGIKVLKTELFDLATTDFMPLMTKVVSMNPDAVEIGSAATGYTAQMAKALHELGYKGIRVSITLSGEADIMVPIIGKAPCEGLVSQNIDFSSQDATPWMREFYQRYVGKYGKPFGAAAAWVYFPVIWLKEAIEATGSFDTDILAKYFETPNKKFNHYFGPSQFGGKTYYGVNHQFKVPVPVTEIRDGKNVLVRAPEVPPLELE